MFTNGGRQEENDSNDKVENPLAVWIRNVPVWLDEDRFYDEISNWPDCDKNNSYWFKNKQDNSWVGIRYGWAIVSFKTTLGRNLFLEDEDRHFVRNSDDETWEKLKVSPWFDKQKPRPVFTRERPVKAAPLYKQDLGKETEYNLEEFNRNCKENSIQAYKGRIHSLQGCIGCLEVTLVSQYGEETELVIFHTDSFWVSDCKSDVHSLLGLGTTVSFNARRLPQGLAKGKRYQAKAIWLGQDTQPNYITAPSTRRLDDWLEQFSIFSSKSSSPDSESRSDDTNISSGKNSPLNCLNTIGRQKPLKGGLNQLNSSQDKVKTTITVRKAPPTNFAQAVASVPTIIKEDHSNLFLATGTVESFLSESEASVFVHEYGAFTLNVNHLDVDHQVHQNISRYLTPHRTEVSLTLRPGQGKHRYEIVRAHINEEIIKNKCEDVFDPFEKEFALKKCSDVNPPADNWEELDDTAYQPIKIEDDLSTSANDIDLDELDQYYDELQIIIVYLENELPKVLPTIANDEKCFLSLANKILAAPRSAAGESKELKLFLDQNNVPDRIKNVFISEFLRFRQFEPIPIIAPIVPLVQTIEKSAFEEAKDIFREPLDNGMEFKRSNKDTVTDGKIKNRVESFFTWLETVVKNQDVLDQKKQLYSAILERPTTLTRIWYEVTLDTTTKSFITFITVSELGEHRLTKIQRWVTNPSPNQSRGSVDWQTFVTWFEGDTNLFRMEECNDPEVRKVIKKPVNSGPLKMFPALELSGLELEFTEYLDAAKETSAFILKCIVFLRRSDVRISGLLSLYNRGMEECGGKLRPRDFNQKVRAILDRQCEQRILDETNQWAGKEGMARMGRQQEHVPISHKRLDKFAALLSQSISTFFFSKGESVTSRREDGRVSKSPSKKHEGDSRGEKEKKLDKTDEITESNIGPTDVTLVCEDEKYSDTEFAPFSCWLELAIASGRVVIPSTATVEGILWCLQARDVSHSTLKSMWNGGAFGWQLRVSQLNLQPPLGVTVPDIAEWLGAYFGSLTNTVITQPQKKDESAGEEENEIMTRHYNLYSPYEDITVRNCLKKLQRSPLAEQEQDMVQGLEEVFNNYMFNGSNWTQSHSQGPIGSVCSLLGVGIWDSVSVTSTILGNNVRDVLDGRNTYKKLLVKWARLLETSSLLPTSSIDIISLIRASILLYTESLPEKDLCDLATDFNLYNISGLVASHLSSSWYTVQTRQAVVLCNLATSFCPCNSELCILDNCFPIGKRVILHSSSIRQEGVLRCHLASLIWIVDGDECVTAPETGIFLPGSVRQRRALRKTALDLVSSEEHNWNDVGVETNRLAYQELMMLYHKSSDFQMENVWPGAEVEMQKMFVFSQMGGMTRPLLRSTWAAALNTTDQEKERILNETFLHFEGDLDTKSMMEFIAPIVETKGLRKAMKILNQEYPAQDEEEIEVNDTDSEKQRRDLDVEAEEEEDDEEDESSLDQIEDPVTTIINRGGDGGTRNRLPSTDTIKDETLLEAETNLEQLWGDHEGDRTVRRPSRRKEKKDQELEKRDETNPSSLLTVRTDLIERKVDDLETGLANWQPMVGDMVSGNRELILQLNSRIEFLENALNQLTLAQASNRSQEEEVKPKVAVSGRVYVKIAREGDEEEVSEVPTNTDGKLPMKTVTALYENTSAMKYRVEGRGTWRALLLEAELYHAPEDDGWGERVYVCAQPQGSITRDTPIVAPPSSHMETLSSFPLSASPWGLPSAPHIWGHGHTTSLQGHTPSLQGHAPTLPGQQFPYSGLAQSSLAKFLPNLPK